MRREKSIEQIETSLWFQFPFLFDGELDGMDEGSACWRLCSLSHTIKRGTLLERIDDSAINITRVAWCPEQSINIRTGKIGTSTSEIHLNGNYIEFFQHERLDIVRGIDRLPFI